MREDNKKKKNEPIKVPSGMVSKLASEFNCSTETVRLALNYRGDSIVKQAIRKKAIKLVDEFFTEHGI